MPAIEGTPFPAVAVAEIPDSAKVEMVFPVEVLKYTLEDGKITKAGSTGETKPPAEVEGANADVTPYLQERRHRRQGRLRRHLRMLGKPLPEEPAEEAADDRGPAGRRARRPSSRPRRAHYRPPDVRPPLHQ